METNVIAMIIFGITVILYCVNKFSPALVSLSSIVAMVAFGVLDFKTAFSGFATNTIMLIAGMMIIGLALIENGITDIIAKLVFDKFDKKPMVLMVAILVSSAVLSAFLQNMAMLVVYFGIIDAYVKKSNGVLKRKSLYWLAMMGTLVGGNSTLVGSSSPGVASNILEELGGGTFSFFESGIIGLPILVVLCVLYPLVLHKIGERNYYKNGKNDDIEMLSEAGDTESSKEKPAKWRMLTAAGIAIATTVSFIFVKSISSGVIALVGACVVMMSGCINSKKAVKTLDWSVLVLLACTSGLANGFVATGLDVEIVDFLTNALGTNAANPAIWVIIFTFLSALITNCVSNASACAIFSVLAVSVATAAGCSPRPLIMACLWGSNSGLSLPISCATVSMTMRSGLNVRNYITVGSLYSLVMCIVTSITIILYYGLV